MVGCIAERVFTALVLFAWIFARLCSKVAVFVVWAFAVALALGPIDADAFASRCEFVSVFFWTNALTTFVDDQASLEGAHAMTGFVDLVSFVDFTDDAFFVDVQSSSRRADTTAKVVGDLIGWANSSSVALDCGIALVAWQTLAHHCSDW